ncbi:sorbosone dehydrogenase family protein [Chamaesiphon sp.]|uniref:PQQ-dependent sugar dehydrogenase n=1 Tax=Chamaesiphon sp. TaxID=2814140 RepID=UPI0035938169
MKNFLRIAGLTSFSLGLSLSGEVVRATNLGIDPIFQSQFQITEFATGLDFPTGLVQLKDGSLLVGTTQGSNFFDANSTGQLVRLQDTNGDGVAEKTILYDGAIAGNKLPGGISGIRAVNDYLFVTSFDRDRISVFQQGANLSANSLVFKGSLDFTFPANRYQATSSLAVRQTGMNEFDLFFNLGAAVNNLATPPNSISISGVGIALPPTALTGDSIYKLPITTGSGLTIGTPTLVATGLRNAAALEVDKKTGDLYIGENGIDSITNVALYQSLTADELNRLTAAQLDENLVVENFGFPAYGEKYGSPGTFVNGEGQDVSINSSFIKPLTTFQPISDPTIPGAESTGVATLAFAPTSFPDELNDGLFLGFFGRLAYEDGDDLKNPLVYYDLATNSYSHFLSTNRSGGSFGHFSSLLSTQDSLFATDMGAGSGLLFSSPGLGLGKVYQIQATQTAQAVPEPFTIVGTLIGGTAALRMRKKLKDGNKA